MDDLVESGVRFQKARNVAVLPSRVFSLPFKKDGRAFRGVPPELAGAVKEATSYLDALVKAGRIQKDIFELAWRGIEKESEELADDERDVRLSGKGPSRPARGRPVFLLLLQGGHET
jgi:hypothetical protein